MSVKPHSAMRLGVSRPGEAPPARPPQQQVITNKQAYVSPPKPSIPVSKPQPEEIKIAADKDGAPLSSQWERINPLSNGIFYDWDDICVKQFNAYDQAKLARAVRKRNLTVLLDVLSATCNRDVRDMAYADFQGICYWHKKNDYLQVKQNLAWLSRYGFRARAEIRSVALKEVYLDATVEEYREWKSKGLRAATCRDLEMMVSDSFDEDTLYLFDKAQHLDPAPLSARIEELVKKGDKIASVTARIEELDRKGLKFWDTIDDFVIRFSDFGLQETAKVQVAKADFDPVKAIEALRSSDDLEKIEEADLIQHHLDNNKPYAPREEEVHLSFDIWSMFPHTGN